ncbi:MAG TPA: hypothetical protein VFX12_08785 [Vicinamibacterales bacterium]|nr:hypothetical protein [Vicinamibacterales bacterium]
MFCRARYVLLASMLIALPSMVGAQSVLQPSPQPLATASNEDWFLAGDPITWSGADYYPAGARVFFNGNQMVRTGSYRGIPLYVDATGDPTVIYVPLAGGLMQPYEQRRAGELAGTVGMQAPSFPVQTSGELQLDRSRPAAQDAIERALRTRPPEPEAPAPSAEAEMPEPPATATTGRLPSPLPAAQPTGVTGIWVEFQGHRWFSAGPAVALDANFTEIGRFHGFPVYRRDKESSTVYLPARDGRIAPYTRALRKRR